MCWAILGRMPRRLSAGAEAARDGSRSPSQPGPRGRSASMATTGLPEVSVSERSAAQAAELVDAGSDEAFARLTGRRP